MNIKLRLSILNFLEFFIWGSWLLSMGVYMSTNLNFSGVQVGSIYATMGITSLFMPAIMGVIADRWLQVEKLFGFSHLMVACLMLAITQVKDFNTFYMLIFLMNSFYMPTIALNYSMSYSSLSNFNLDIIKTFPSIRIWGTIGFIIAAWVIDVMNWSVGKQQFLLSAGASFLLGFFALTFPKTSVSNTSDKSISQTFISDSLKIFRNRRLLIFFVFSILLGSILQITNIWGVPFLNDFVKEYPNAFAVRHSVFLLSLSQISETVFILAIPFFYKKYGIKTVILLSMVAWVFRFSFFAIGSPEGVGLAYLIASMIIYGMAFDFFNISGSLYIEQETPDKIRSSAQGLFAVTTGGFGPILGAYCSGYIVDFFTINGTRDWFSIWMIFSIYALVIAVLFSFLFKHKHVLNN